MVLKNTINKPLIFLPLLTAIINNSIHMEIVGRKKSVRLNIGFFRCNDMNNDAKIGTLAICMKLLLKGHNIQGVRDVKYAKIIPKKNSHVTTVLFCIRYSFERSGFDHKKNLSNKCLGKMSGFHI